MVDRNAVTMGFAPRRRRRHRIGAAALAVALALAAPVAGLAANAPDPAPATDAGSGAGAGADMASQEKAARSALSANPNDADAHLRLGQILVDQGKYQAAQVEARAAQQGAQHDAADALLAWSLFLANDKNVLFAQVKPGERQPHAESIVRLSLGLAQLDALGLDRAEPLLRDAVRLDPASWRAHIALARLLILRRELPQAREQVDAARAIAPDEVGVERIAAELARAAGDTDGAIAAFSNVLARHPTSVPALAGRADALISQDRLDEAHQDIQAALKLGRHSDVVFLGALVLAREGKMAEADQLLAVATPSFGRMQIGYYLQGVLKFWLGLPETANASLERFQGRQPNLSAVIRLRAEIALRRKDPGGAIKLLQPLVEAAPADQAAVTELARAYLANGQPELVIQLFQTVAAAPPGKPVQEADITGLIMTYGDAAGDLTAIEKVVLSAAPETVVPLDQLRQGDIANAAAAAEALVQKTPGNPFLLQLLGSVRLAQGRLPEAEAIFRGLLDKSPDFTAAGLGLVQTLVAEKRLEEAQSALQGLARRASDAY